MTNRITTPPKARTVIVGVDTHTHVHVAVAIDSWGIRLGDHAFVADSGGYEALVTWAETHGRIEAFGIEGTGSYGAGLARAVHRAGHHVVEVNRGDRRTRRAAGKSDTLDAEVAARSLLAGQSTAIPKTADGAVEMIRQLKITRDTAMKARTTAMNTLQQIIVQAPPVLREALHDLTDHGLLTRCAGLRPGPIDTPIASAKHTLRSLTRRWMALAEEIALHDQHLARLTTATSPTLCEGVGVGAHTAAHSGEELDIKPYEADMRHLLNTYIQADPAVDLGGLGEMSLTELIIETGIHDAIAKKLNEKGTLSKNAIAEGIINNVRKTIIREQLTDPRFYEQMSKLLDDLIKQNRADATAYEEFLRKAEALVKRLAGKQSDEGVPAALHGKREATVIYNNLPRILEAGRAEAAGVTEPSADYGDDPVTLALEIDRVMRERAPAGWKGDQAREAQVLNALFPLLDRDREATRALFELIKNQPGY